MSDMFNEHTHLLETETNSVEVASKLSNNQIEDGEVIAGRLEELDALDEMDKITSNLSPKAMDLLANKAYMDSDTFTTEFYTLSKKDQNEISRGIIQNEQDQVEEIAASQAADKIANLDLSDAKEFVNSYVANLDSFKKINAVEYQWALDKFKDPKKAVDYVKYSKNRREVETEFNMQYLNYLGKQEKELDELYGELPPPPTSPLFNRLAKEMRKNKLRFNDYSTENLGTQITNETEAINYLVAKARYFNDVYGIPLEDPSIGLIDQYPIIAASLSAVSGPVAGGLAFAFDGPVDTAVEYSLNSSNPILATGGTIIGAVALEWAIPKVAVAIGKYGFIKPANKLYKALDFAGVEALDPKVMEDLFLRAGSYPKQSDISKVMTNKTVSTDVEAGAKTIIPTTKVDNDAATIVTFKGDNVEEAKAALNQIEHTQIKSGTQQAMSGVLYKGYFNLINKALDDDNFGLAVDLVNKQTLEGYTEAKNIITELEPKFTIKPGFTRNIFTNWLPEESKEAFLNVPNQLVNIENSIKRSHNRIINYINKTLSSGERKQLDDLLIRMDSNLDVPSMESLPIPVRDAYQMYRKLNKKGIQSLNEITADVLEGRGIRDYLGKRVQIIEDLETGGHKVKHLEGDEVIEVADPTLLKRIDKPIKEVDNYFHREYTDPYAVSVKNDKGKWQRVMNAATGKEALEIAGKYADEGLETYAHRSTFDPNRTSKLSKGLSHLAKSVRSAVDDVQDNTDTAMDILHAAGVGKYDSIQVIDEIMGQMAEKLPFAKGSDKYKAFVAGTRKITGRTKEEAIGNMLNFKDSYKGWARAVSETAISKQLYLKLQDDFMEKFGKYVDGTSYLDEFNTKLLRQDDPTGGIEKAMKLYRAQLNNIGRIPRESEIFTEEAVDKLIFSMYKSNSKLARGLGKVLDKSLNTFEPVSTLRSLTYTSKLGLNAVQIPLQASFALFGAAAHADLLSNPKVAASVGKDLVQLISAFTLKKLGRGRFVDIKNPRIKAMYDTILDGGYMTDLMGTETASGLASSVQKVLMSPVALGESGNRLFNIVTAMHVAETEGLKIGTKEFGKFVGAYYSKYSQVLNHLTNSPLTASKLTSWNVGMFMKFQMNWADQFYGSGLTPMQKVAIAGVSTALYGKYGVPFVSDAVEIYNIGEDTLKPMFTQMGFNLSQSMMDQTLEDMYEYVDTLDLTKQEKAQLKKDIKKDNKVREQYNDKLKQTNIGDLMKDTDGSYETFLGKILNFEGIASNKAMAVGWRSKIEQFRNFGVSGALMGPLLATMKDVHPLDVMGNSLNIISQNGEIDSETYKYWSAEFDRHLAATFPAVSKIWEGSKQLGDIIGLYKNGELEDVEGNLIDFTDILTNPDLQIAVELKQQTAKSINKKVLSGYTRPKDIVWRLLGTEAMDIQERKKAESDLYKLRNNFLDPQSMRVAELINFYMDSGDLRMAQILEWSYRKLNMDMLQGTPLNNYAQQQLDRDIRRVRTKQTIGYKSHLDSEMLKSLESVIKREGKD